MRNSTSASRRKKVWPEALSGHKYKIILIQIPLKIKLFSGGAIEKQ